NLNTKNGSNFVDYVPPAPPAKDPEGGNVAWADVEANKVYFHPNVFFAKTATNPAGMDVKSASWVVVHEMGHLIIGDDSFPTCIDHNKNPPRNNPYSFNSQYYLDGADQCVKNPDSYAHFAYQIIFGKPNVGPY